MPREPFPKIESAALREFADLAGAYCRTIERHRDVTGPEFLAKVHTLLPSLYAAGLALPDTGILYPDGDEDDEDADYEIPEPSRDRIDHDEWRRLYHSIQDVVGPRNFYREVFDPYEPLSEKEVTGSLADDLVDTYRDLRSGLAAWQRGDTGDALWEWRFLFEVHWGEHVTGALRAIHIICSTYDGTWPVADGGAA